MSANIRLAPVLLVVVATVMVLAGVLGLQHTVLSPVLESWRTRGWVATPAILDDIKLLAADGTPIPIFHDPRLSISERASIMPTGIVKLSVRYHYYIGEQSFDGNRFGLFEGLDDGDAQRLAAASMHRKQEIQVWVNPDNPSESILNRDLHWGVMAMGLPLLATAFAGLVILGYAVKTGWQLHLLTKRVKAAKHT